LPKILEDCGIKYMKSYCKDKIYYYDLHTILLSEWDSRYSNWRSISNKGFKQLDLNMLQNIVDNITDCCEKECKLYLVSEKNEQ
jgi:hypothetical protein